MFSLARTMRTYGATVVLFFICFACAAFAQSAGSSEAAIKALQTGGHVLLLRHAQTVPGVGDPPQFKLEDCSTQRNLSDAGRQQARALGARLRAAGVKFDTVYSSAWCRCVDTATLAFEQKPILLPALYSTFNDRIQQPNRTEELRQFIRSLRTAGNVAMVTHQVVISALTQEFTNTGEGLVLKPDANERTGFKLVGKL